VKKIHTEAELKEILDGLDKSISDIIISKAEEI
jgi:hypothetical protein